jgi:hypothetical protein
MITTLMMLLGLSGAGAGLYNVIKKPGELSDSGDEPREQGAGRRRRGRGGERESESTPRKPDKENTKGEPPRDWGGRGEELPFSTPKSDGGRMPRGDARPLPEGLPSLEDWTSDSENPEPNKKQPRRRNKKTEEEQPTLADIPLGDFGNDEVDAEKPSESSANKPRREAPDLSFSADDIISKNSKYSFHRRPLLNAEALIEKKSFEEAIEIFQRTGDRIPDAEIKGKIQKNISDLEDFIEEVAEQEEEAQNKPAQEKESEKPNRKLDFDRDLSQEAGFQDFVSAMKQVADVFADSIAKAIQYAQASVPPGNLPQPQQPMPGPTSELPLPGESSPSQRALPPPGNVGADFLHPIIYQFLKDAPPLPGYTGIDTKEEKQNYENLIKSLNQGLMAPPQIGMPFPAPMGGNAPAPGIVGPFYLPNPEQLQTDFSSLSGALNRATDGANSLADIASGLEKAKGEIKNKDISELDLPEDTFFSDEWQNFRGLPLVDRRIGGERRKNTDRRENKAGRKDRRSGDDRRKVNRFKERENYLKDKALEKLEDSAKRAQSFAPPSLNDLLKPYFPPLPERLNLPESRDLREKEEDKPKEEEPKPEEWIEDDPEWFDKTTEALRKEVTLPEPIDPRAPTFDLPHIGLPDPIDPAKAKSETIIETDDPIQVELMARAQEESLKIGLPDPEEAFRDQALKKEEEKEAEEEPELDEEPPEIELIDGELGEISEAKDTPDEMANKIEEEPEKIIHGVLELKPPEADDAPFLTLTYDFGKIPHAFRLSKNYSIMEYSYYKYKPMLMKAQEFARRKMLKNALNYYRVIKSQNIPPELRKMINRNIRDITEFMEKFLMAKGG